MRRFSKSIQKGARSFIGPASTGVSDRKHDINYDLTVTRNQIVSAAKVQLIYERDGKPKKLSVKIPTGLKDGTRLRLKKMGHQRPFGGSGDLYLHIRVSS